MATNRRTFLRQATEATAIGAIAIPPMLRRTTPNEAMASLGFPVYDEAELKAIAMLALDAAKKAGAKFADVRVNFANFIRTRVQNAKSDGPGLISSATLGIRTVTDGVWGFAGVATVDPKEIVAAAELSVIRAKAGRPRTPKAFDYVDASVVSGRWEAEVKKDPFDVPFKDHEAIVLEAAEAVQKIEGLRFNIGLAAWNRKDTCFASSEGSLVFQKFFNCGVGGSSMLPSKKDPDTWVGAGTQIPGGSYGYEALSESNFKEEWLKGAEEALRLANLNIKSTEVGRYDIVFSRDALAGIMADTIGAALWLDRARGDLANSAGTSYAAPPADILGKYRVGSSSLTVTADRSRKFAGASCGWDSDGVKPEEFTIVKEGLIVDYLTTRDTANTIADHYKQQGKPVKSHACSVNQGMAQPSLGNSNYSIQPGKQSAKAEDLYKDLKKGFFCPSGYIIADQQLINVAGYFQQPIYEITNGKIVGLAKDFGIQFNTAQFWKNLDVLGGADSAGLENIPQFPLNRLELPNYIGVHTVPGRVKQVNVINTGKEV